MYFLEPWIHGVIHFFLLTMLHSLTLSSLFQGDSAGGNIVSMVAALVCNPKVLRRTILLGGEKYKGLLSLSAEDLPRVCRVALLYRFLGVVKEG